MSDTHPNIDELLALASQRADGDALVRDLVSALEYARESWHLANGVAELAMRHRDISEARLRELASAEPVAWVDGENFVWPKGKRRPSNCDALIRRPEMPA